MRRQNASRATALSVAWCVASVLAANGIAQERDSEHVLFQAIRRGDTTLLKDILRRGTPPDVRSRDGTTPLMIAALHGSAEMVELLLKHGADPRITNDRDVTALLWAARDAEKVRLLIHRGAQTNAASDLGNTPLMAAAGSPGAADSVELLLSHGADVTRRNKGGRTALYFAANGGDTKIVRLLLDKARDLDKLADVVRDASPAVAAAANGGFHEIVNLLLEHGADPNQSTGSRGRALNTALMAGHPAIAASLIVHGAGLDDRSQPGDTPTTVLAAYTELDDASVARLLKERGADFTAHDADGRTALTWARMRGHRSLIDSLLDAGTPEGQMPPRPEIPLRPIDLDGPNRERLIGQSVQKGIDLLQRSSDTFLDVRSNCVSCHHQNLPGVAIAWARDRGFPVRQATIDRMMERQVQSWAPRVDRAYELDSPFPVPPSFLGWGMWSFAELGYRPDALTQAVSWYLESTQQSDGRWVPGMLRPPLGGDEIQATMLAMRSLQLYPLPGRAHDTLEHVARARRWLENAQPLTHEDEVCRMLGLAWAGAEPDTLASEVRKLLDSQRPDGGWAQLPGLPSDAWATGQSLVALHTAGGLPTDDPAYRRGIAMLLRTQFDDGSWFVQSRSWPFQPYFESDFPYGRDQWISAAGTAWAVMALVLELDPSDVARSDALRAATPDKVERRTVPAETPKALVPAATRAIDFARDIKPIFARSCIGCHGNQNPKSNFSLTSREALLRGGDSELPAIVPEASQDSPLVRFAANVVSKMEMPPLNARGKYPALSDEEIALLRAWIDQGAKWSSVANESPEGPWIEMSAPSACSARRECRAGGVPTSQDWR
jgi:ankyrin repeat protein/mono/diheme cytochrome c family protein